MSEFLGIAQKVRHFLILVPKTVMISWQKFSNGTVLIGNESTLLIANQDGQRRVEKKPNSSEF